MTKDKFINTLKKWDKEYNDGNLIVVGSLEEDGDVIVDDKGFIWINEFESWRRVKTSVNVTNIIAFRKSRYDNTYYIICSDDTGFMVDNGTEFYYCIDGRPSGYGSAFNHFMEFPVGDCN